ncbi:putative lipoprotein [Thermacetogenium phaeum DSM 12270]|uniref:Putative lipoprotein n=2 Tax=Thermacetogenium phaeum TaxID=85874 RepID=K4LR90_THEPS|nr:putative lipoprotein [Thermacetogenium phaeum DSM 12270]KUK36429.1 MAG: Putative lipoprotein [Thermacetogenium phaeum]MDK2880276.1 hypothetical protein [Clostridia bacterium]MDN5366348.1 hypothetical protein [Thermacetogenium sp.]
MQMHLRRTLLLAAAAAAIVALTLGGTAGCSSQKEAAADPTVEEIVARIAAAVDLSRMQEGDAGTLKKLYGIDAADLEGFALYTAPTNISADEILVVKLKDPDAAGAVQEKMEKRVADRAARFKDYLPQEYYKIEHHVLETRGSCLLLAIAEDADKIAAAFDESFR